MARFRVWAPNANKMELDLRGRVVQMQKAEEGYWQIDVDAPVGADYAYRIDGGRPLPDPRSAFQPAGVHGFSRTIDHAAFHWTDERWQSCPLASAIFYELHVGTFSPEGTFDGVIAHMDYLHDLGVTHIELMPVNEFVGDRGWGYDGAEIFAPYHAYGGPDGLKRLVDAAHGKGLGVCLDVVYNHFGPEGSYAGAFGPYMTNKYCTPWGDGVNMDGPLSDEVRRFFIDNARMWLREYHMDGLRLDGVFAIIDNSAVHFLEALADAVARQQDAIGRHAFLIAESDLNDPRLMLPSAVGGYGLDAQWNDDFHHALRTTLTGDHSGYYTDFGGLADLAKAIRQAYVLDGRFSPGRRRKHGRYPRGLSGRNFVVYSQDHDQVGNRAVGDRLSHAAGAKKAKIAAALTLTAPYVPLLFQGEEWDASTPFQFFSDYQDPKLATTVREGRRKEFESFGWKPEDIPDPQDPQTFLRSKLNWEERSQGPHAEILDWYRQLIRLRRISSDIGVAPLQEAKTRFHEQENWLIVQRNRTSIAVNFSGESRSLRLESSGSEIVLKSDDAIALHDDTLDLPAESVAILTKSPQ